jgi:predicted DNA-binding protein YlxM (UPF0122 family)
LNCSNEKCGQHDDFQKLVDSFTDEFYSNLLTFFLTMDLTGFNVKDIPMTEAKLDLINVSKQVIDDWIADH